MTIYLCKTIEPIGYNQNRIESIFAYSAYSAACIYAEGFGLPSGSVVEIDTDGDGGKHRFRIRTELVRKTTATEITKPTQPQEGDNILI
jgi:hypothetical protein